MSDYLFDGEGTPDPEIEQLERVLAPLAYSGAAPDVAPRRRTPYVIIAATVVAAAGVVLLWPGKKPPPAKAGWTLTVLRGTATIDRHVVVTSEPLAPGEWLETGAGRARLDVPGIGTVELGPGSRARVIASSPLLHEVELSSGKLSARVAAPPRHFAVTLPHARVVDLGCAFTIELDEEGRGKLVVTEGAVSIGAPDVTVSSGEACELDEHGHGPPHALVAIAPAAPRPRPQSAPRPHGKNVPLPTHTPIGPGDDATPAGPSRRDSFREHGL